MPIPIYDFNIHRLCLELNKMKRLSEERTKLLFEKLFKLAVTLPPNQLISVGTCFGKFTKSNKFRLHKTALTYLAPYAQCKIWLKPSAEQQFLYANHTSKSGLGRITLIGSELRQSHEPNSLVVTRASILCHKFPNTYWVETSHKRYIPKKGDLVVGTVIKKSGDTLRVDIGSAELASLSLLAFEGATKKQKPDLLVGDVLYAKLLSAHREMEPELVCIDKYYKAGNLGLLSDGFLVTVLPSFVHRLLNIEHPLLRTLSKKFPFEIATGMNGKIWFKSGTTANTLTLLNCLLAAEHQSDKDIYELCRQYIGEYCRILLDRKKIYYSFLLVYAEFVTVFMRYYL